MKALYLFLMSVVLTGIVSAQDKSYNTDQLKSAKRISEDQWKGMLDASSQRSNGFVTAAKGTTDYMATQLGYTVLKYNQTIELKAEVIAVLEGVYSAGQSNAGTVGTRNPKTFKLGPGKYEVKEGIIKRVP
ncbi:MAG TPA: hypothetical protein PLA15_03325 [bacterium]|nr:hypothetical protein [bacterium]